MTTGATGSEQPIEVGGHKVIMLHDPDWRFFVVNLGSNPYRGCTRCGAVERVTWDELKAADQRAKS